MAELKNTIINGSVRLNGSSSGWSYLDLDNKIEITPNTSGNVVTGISIANNIITLTKGIMATGPDITAAINALDKSDSAVAGKYVSAVSQTNGIITVSRAALPTLSGGNTAVAGKYVSAVSVSGHAITITTETLPTISITSDGSSGNVITGLSSSGHTITATKGTALTSVKTLKTTSDTKVKIPNGLSIEGTGDIFLHDIARTGKWADIVDKPEINNNNQTIKVGSTSFDPNDVINIVGTTNNITVTPTTTSGAETITFNIGANVVTASTDMGEDQANQIVTVAGAETKTIQASGKSFVTTVASTGATNTNVPTELAVRTAINNAIGENDAMVYKGTLTPNGTSSTTNAQPLPAADKGHTYKITSVGFIGNVAVQAGDMVICNTDGTAAGTSSNWSTLNSRWDFIQSNIDAATSNALGLIKLGNNTVIDGTAGKTYPVQLNASKQAFVAVPWTNTAHTHTNGVGLTRTGGGGISGTVDYKVSLVDETPSTYASTYVAGGSSKFYAVQLDKKGKLAVNVPWDTDTNTTYTLGTNQEKIILTPSSGAATQVQLTGTNGINISTVSSEEIKIGHSNTITSKTTQALYPIKFDAQGHITESGAAVTSLKNPNALTIGTSTPTAYTYDGSAARTINVTGGENVSVTHSNGTFTVSLTDGSDTKVTQTPDTSSTSVFPILAKNTAGILEITDTSRFAPTIAIKPSTGEIRSQALKLAASTADATTGCTMQYNATTQCLEFIFT